MKYLHLLLITLLYPICSYAYYPTSPYSYCGGDPVNCIDPTGEDIVVLNYTEGTHLAMLIQNEEGKWQYYSVNGNNFYISGSHSGGRTFNDVAVGSWDSPEDFLNSSYNVRTENSKEDKSMNHFGYSEGYQIPSTKEQDTTMRESFTKIAQTKYNLIFNNCATAVQKTMIDAGIPVSEPTMIPSTRPMQTPFGVVDVYNGDVMKCNTFVLPSSAFQSIIRWNPSGQLLHKK